MRTVIISEAHKKALKKKHKSKKPSAQEQVGGKVNAAIMGAVTCGGMCEGAEPTNDTYTLGMEENAPAGGAYYHITEEAEKVSFEVTGEQIRDPKHKCKYSDKDAYAFGEYKGQMYISRPSGFHGEIADDIKKKSGAYGDILSDFESRGRFWTGPKYITFWFLDAAHIKPEIIKPIISKLNDVVKDREDLKGENFFDYTLFYDRDPDDGLWDEFFSAYKVPVREFLGMSKPSKVPSTANGMSTKDFWRHYEIVAEERGVNLADETDAVDNLIEYIIEHIKDWETLDNQVEMEIANQAYGIGGRYDIPKSQTVKQQDRFATGKDGEKYDVAVRKYKIDMPKDKDLNLSFIDNLDIKLNVIDYSTDDKKHFDDLKDLLKGGNVTGGYGSDWGTKVDPQTKKTNNASISINFRTVNGEITNPSGFYGLMYHELGHGKNDNIRMNVLGNKGRLGASSVDYWSHRNNKEWMNNGVNEVESAFGALIYRFWEPDEMSQGSAQVFGDLKGLGNTDRKDFQDTFKQTATSKEWEVLKKAYKTLEDYSNYAEQMWNNKIISKYNDKKGFLRFKDTASIYNKKDGQWKDVHPRKKTLSFKQFMKQTKEKMDKYLKNMGRSASLYYDKAEIVSENVKPSSIDLSSFKIQDDLNAKFWKDDRLDSRIRMKLLEIADDFIENLGVNWVKPKDITMTGSLANYNWSKEHSDIDLHVIMKYKDVDERVEFVREYFKNKKTLWNEAHEDLKIFGFPVEVYVQDTDEPAVTGGVYSLEKDKWITKPKKKEMSDKDLNKDKIRKEVATYMDRIDEIGDNFKKADDNYKIRKVSEKANKLFDEIVTTRRKALKDAGKEMCDGNIIFKMLRRNGYLDKLCQISDDAYNKMNSIVAEGIMTEEVHLADTNSTANPDTISFTLNGEQVYYYYHETDGEPYPFAVTFEREWVMGNCGEGHGELSRRINQSFVMRGRLWAKPKIFTIWSFYPQINEMGQLEPKDKMDLREYVEEVEAVYREQVDPSANLEDWYFAWEAYNEDVNGYIVHYAKIRELLHGKSKKDNTPSTASGMRTRDFWRHYEVIGEGKLNEDTEPMVGMANPDSIKLKYHGKKLDYFYKWEAGSPYPFGADMYTGDWYLGTLAERHEDLSPRVGAKFGDETGRLWADEKFITTWFIHPELQENGMPDNDSKADLRDLIKSIEPLYRKQVDPSVNFEDWNFVWDDFDRATFKNYVYIMPVREFLHGKRSKKEEPSTSTGISNRDFWRHYEVVAEEKDMEKKQKVYLMVGIPGSGKSTWIKNHLGDIDVVSRDIIRAELGFTKGVDEKAVCTREQEQEVTSAEYAKIKKLAKSGKDFAIDDTNTGKFRAKMIDYLRSHGLHIVCVRMNTDIETCIKRRDGQIPADVMRKIHAGLVEPQEGEYDDIINVN